MTTKIEITSVRLKELEKFDKIIVTNTLKVRMLQIYVTKGVSILKDFFYWSTPSIDRSVKPMLNSFEFYR